MISFGSRIATLKRDVIDYIFEKVEKERAYKLEPGDLFISNNKCYYKMHAHDQYLSKNLNELSVELLCIIADKIHFRPLGGTVKQVTAPKPELVKPKVEIQKSEDMFEIKKNIPLPGQVFDKDKQTVMVQKGKHTNYRALPLKDMQIGDCIIIHECNESTINSRYSSTSKGVERFVALMDTKKKFKVAKTEDLKIGVWRVE